MDIERYGYPIPSPGGLQWRLHRSCSNEASKLVNSISLDWDTHFIKPLIFFICSLFKPFQWILIKGWPYFSQNLKAKNKLLGLQVWKNRQNLKKPSLLQNHHCKTSISTKLAAVKHTQKISHYNQRACFDEGGSIFY